MRLKLYRGKWCAVWREGGTTRRVSLRTPDRGLAERRLKDVQEGQKRETAGNTVADAVESYLTEKRGRARSHGSMLTAWRALKPTFGHLRPDQIGRNLCRAYAVQRRAAGVADGTIIKDLGVLRAALRWAGKASAAVFDLPPAPPPRETYLTREDFDRLLAACTAPHIRLFAILALSTAGRASAILELTWDRVDFERGVIRLSRGEDRRKGRATVPMTERARTALVGAAKARETEYAVEWGGKRVKSVKRAFATACRNAGLPDDVTPHILRHSAAVWMAEAGVSMDEIAQYLGHSSSRVTYAVYARYSPDHLRKAAKALE